MSADLDADPTPDEIREGTVSTVGVSSAVLRTDDAVERAVGDLLVGQVERALPTPCGGYPRALAEAVEERADAAATEVLGHVMFLDFDDDATLLDVRREAVARLDGIVAIWESSPGSYHVWSLTVRDLDAQILRALRTGSDPMHVQQSYRRGRFIVRCAPKFRVDDDGRATEQYKDAPQLVEALIVEDSEGWIPPQSRPHYELLHTLAAEQGADLDLDGDRLDRVAWRGQQLFRSDYLTMDDATKRRGLA